jgi:limonene 1,2-monooxygenase
LWAIGEETAEKHGKTLRREDWSLVVPVYLAESRREAIEDVRIGSGRELTEYFGATLGHPTPDVPANQVVDFMVERQQWMIGTPDDCIAGIERLQEISGGFGGFLVRVVDWATREKTLHSYELLARYVMPRFQGSLAGIQVSNQWASARREALQANRIAGLKRATEAYYGQQH